jgi:hypothetical protein
MVEEAMLRTRYFVSFATLLLVGLGCAAQQLDSHAATEPSKTPSAGAASVLTADSLEGTWVEFWALTGHADTQRYAFFADGRFGWRAPASDGAAVGARWGHAKLSPGGSEILLDVEGQAATLNCEPAAACRVLHDPPVQERLQVGTCPDNDEARRLDPQYLCFSLGGRAFWRHAHEVPDPHAYFP